MQADHGRIQARPSMTGIARGERPDWRDAAAYRRLVGVDRAGLMWEWLRRDPDYIAWHARASRVTRGAEVPRWGLHFRRGARAECPGGPDHLVRRTRSRNASGHRLSDPCRRPRWGPSGAIRVLVDRRERPRWDRARRAIGWVASHSPRCRGGAPVRPQNRAFALPAPWHGLRRAAPAAAPAPASSFSPWSLRPNAVSSRSAHGALAHGPARA